MEFRIWTTPKQKKPSYANINEDFRSYLDFLKEHYQSELLKKRFRTIKDEPYIDVEVFIEKLNALYKSSTEGREGISQSLELVRPERLLTNITTEVVYAIDQNYGALTEANGRTYQNGLNMIVEGERRTVGYKDEEGNEIKRFKKLLLEDSLNTLGEYPEGPTPLRYSGTGFDFIHQIEPRQSYKHASIYNQFAKELPRKITKKSKTGDLMLIQAIRNDPSFKNALLEKGLIDESFLNDYDPQLRGGYMLVRLQGVIDRFDHYKNKVYRSEPSIEQNITIERVR